jgi:N-acetyl-anhydromuramyl-L-alanine amidase AmpD
MDPKNWRTLRQGMTGPDVVAWKRILFEGDAFDAVTHEATRQWQRDHRLDPDGIVGRITRDKIGSTLTSASPSQPEIKFMPAKFFRQYRRAQVSLVVMHSAETSERPETAEALGAYFADPKRLNNAGELVPVTASAHYSVDSNSIVQSVKEEDVAFHVRARGVNDMSIGVELAGRASQSREEWLDTYGKAMLPLAANLVRGICERHQIPLERSDALGLRSGKPGITSHVDIRDAFSEDTHYDPGPGFPWDVFMDLVRAG